MVKENSHFVMDVVNDNPEAMAQLMSLNPEFASQFADFSKEDLEKLVLENPQ